MSRRKSLPEQKGCGKFERRKSNNRKKREGRGEGREIQLPTQV